MILKILIMLIGSFAHWYFFFYSNEGITAKGIISVIMLLVSPFLISLFIFSLPKIFKNVKLTARLHWFDLAFWLWVLAILSGTFIKIFEKMI